MELDPDFEVHLEDFQGKPISSIRSKAIGDCVAIDILVGNQRLCLEIPEKGSRIFLMKEDGTDGAGVFPLEEQ